MHQGPCALNPSVWVEYWLVGAGVIYRRQRFSEGTMKVRRLRQMRRLTSCYYQRHMLLAYRQTIDLSGLSLHHRQKDVSVSICCMDLQIHHINLPSLLL